MIEPEISFCDLEGLMDIEEDCLKYIVKTVLEKCPEEIEFCDKFIQNGLIEKLQKLINSNFVRIDHKDVIDILKKADSGNLLLNMEKILQKSTKNILLNILTDLFS